MSEQIAEKELATEQQRQKAREFLEAFEPIEQDWKHFAHELSIFCDVLRKVAEGQERFSQLPTSAYDFLIGGQAEQMSNSLERALEVIDELRNGDCSGAE